MDVQFCCCNNIWNWNQLWNNTTKPEFNRCWLSIVPSWTLAIIVCLVTPFQIFGSCRDTTKALPYTKPIILRFLLVLMIISLNVSHFIVDFRAFIVYRKHQVMSVDDNQSYAELFAPLFQAGTFTLFGILLHTYQYRGIRTSGIAWSFTLLAVLLQCPELYMLTTLETDRDCFHVITFITQTICLLILHILTCFADKSKSKNKFYRNKVQQQKEESLLQSPSIQSNVSFEIEEDELEANLHQLECPSVRSSFLSLITFWWITPLMFAGYRETIFTDDLWLLRSNETCRHIIEQYIRSKNRWRRKICIWERLFQSFARSLLMGAIAQSIYIILLFTSPFILRYLLLSLSTNNEPDWHCYVLAILIFMVAMFQSATRTYIEHIMGHTRIAIRTALNGMIYRKLLRIHNCSRSRLTRTKMDKMLRSDVGRIADLMLNFQTLWSTPIIIGLTFYFLWNELERSILNGIILVAIIPLANLIISVVRHRLIQMRLQCKHERMETISQVLTRMLTIKLNGWEIPFIGKITNIREREICFISYISYLSSLVSAVWNLLPYSIAWLILSDYVTNNNFIDEIVIQPSKLFFILSLIEIVREPIVTFSELIGDLPEMIKIGRRLNRFFNLPDLEPYLNRYESSDDNAIEIHCGTFSWEQWIAMQSTIVLSCVDLAIKRGSLVAFVGNCETGKSSLISAMLGDMEQLDGEVMVARGETIAYVPQTPWIRIGTLRDNILFGLPYDKARYDEIIDLCYLKADFDSFPDGDITLINQHNRSLITIGQRQRISIARACYSMATIILFDDPVSTLSVPMAKQIFERVIGNDGYLRNRTRVIATNNIGVMRHADQIVVLANGTVYQTGSYQKLMDAKGKFVNLLNDYLRKKVENHSNENENESNDYCEQTTKDNGGGGGGDKLWRPPDPQSSGNVRPKIYYTYFDSLTSIFMVATICGFGFWQLFVIVSDVWLTLWSSGDLSPNSFGKRQPSNMTIDPVWQLNQQHLTIYGLFGMAQLIANVIGTFALSMGNVRSSIRLHRQLLERIMKAPMYYLDIGTIEKILDHFSTDVDVLDFQLAFTFARWIIAFVQLISILLFIIVKIPWTLLVIIPMVLTYWYIQKLYSSTCRQLFRLDSQIQCTIVNHFHETIDGTSTIRAFDRCAQFIRESNNHIDQYQRINRPLLISDLWLNLRLDWLGNVFLLIVTILAILMHDDLGNGFIGLIVLYSFTIGGILKRLVHHSRNWEQNMISVEHINELCYIPNEREWIRKRNENPNVSKQWPTKGIVEIRNFSTKYCDGLRMVVEGITANIDSSEKIAIVGTDGAGKSSLLMSMFRIIEAIDGKIQIDGVDISRIGLHELRQRLSIVTGNPTLFHETIRFNLDPFGQYEDNELWEALADCYLKDLIQKFDLGLNHMIISDNWLSIGQRQLFGLARALLRGTRVLFFEELDSKNDSVVETMIQRTIRNVFQHCTILTIVHQFATLLHCDRVMVLDSGKLIEFDEPATLLSNRRSHLYKLVKEDNIFRYSKIKSSFTMMAAIVNKQIEPLRSEQISFLNRINEPNNDQSKIITRKKSRQLKIEYYVVPVVVFIVTLIVIAIICIRQSNNSSKIITINDVDDNEQNKETNPEMKKRQDFIRKMTQDAWNAYVKYGWTHDTIRPLTNQSLDQTFGPGMGLTIVSSMSTLWMMNLKEEFQMGRDWIENELNFNKLHREIDVQDAVNFYIGGLLSCYALTGSVDEMFVNKSRHIADRLDPVYRSPTGLPYWKIRPADGLASYSTPFLSAVGGQHLEYEYLYRITGNGTYRDRIQRIRSFLELMPKQSGLYMHQINVESGRWHSSTTTLSMVGRSFYNYLLRSFIQSNGEDFSAWNMFVDAIDAIEQTKMFINSSDTGLLYIRPYNLNLRYKRYPKYMNFESCSLGAMFALAANQLSNSSTLSSTSSLHLNDLTLKEKYWNLSLQLTRTCTEHANQTLSGFAPNRFYFDTDEFDDVNLNDSGRHVLFPELAETYFILWRLTKNSLYQDLAWKLAQRINLYCRTPNGGYTRIVDVNKMPVDQRPDQQDVVLLSSTLKYLYLTFTDNFPLERWVFNERAQPFPIFNL